MAGETAVETPVVVDNKVEEVVKTDKEAIVEEEAAALKEEKKDEEKKEEKEKPAPKEKENNQNKFGKTFFSFLKLKLFIIINIFLLFSRMLNFDGLFTGREAQTFPRPQARLRERCGLPIPI